MGGEKKI